MENIYFLENVISTGESENQRNLILFNATLFYENENIDKSEVFTVIDVKESDLNVDFVSGFVKFNGNQIINANNSFIARHFLSQNNAFRHLLIHNQLESIYDEMPMSDPFSYHVNVGHGNCSIIVDNKKIIVIDCSNYDTKENKNYQKNIDHCISFIKKKFNIANFKISSFLLTHPHFDHYSGINELIRNNYIDNKTRFYLNVYYSMPSPSYNRTLQNIYQTKCHIIEPIISNSNKLFDIIYPDTRLVKTQNTIYNHMNPIIDKNPNNASVVTRIISKNKTFTFTGDIETSAWNKISTCIPHIKNTNYYAISHHGSLNGHLRNTCPRMIPIANISNCLSPNIISVIMGRSGAYPGIPSPIVLNDFSNLNLFFSEKDNSSNTCDFLEIEWANGNTNWY